MRNNIKCPLGRKSFGMCPHVVVESLLLLAHQWVRLTLRFIGYEVGYNHSI